MSRFGYEDEDGIPWQLWETIVGRTLAGRRGQAALAELEAALLALPEQKLIAGHLACEGQVCAVGAYVARQRAQADGVSIRHKIFEMSQGVTVDDVSPAWETVDAGKKVGLQQSLAWHLAYMNDEELANRTPEQRYDEVLAFVRRAQGKAYAA